MEAYSNLYIDDISDSIGTMCSRIHKNNLNIDSFWHKFINSNIANQIEIGNVKYLNYSSLDILNELNIEIDENIDIDFDKYYWAGWIITRYQRLHSISFKVLNIIIPIKRLIKMYYPLHEAGVLKTHSVLDDYVKAYNQSKITNLATIRKRRGFSQTS